MALAAIIFGSIGTLTETSELQRGAFNAAFAEAGLGWHWSVDQYRQLVADGLSGGAARIAAFAAAEGVAMLPAQAALLHDRKSALFQNLMQVQGLAPNAGVVDLLLEARAAGIRLGMASTTSARNIAAMFAATAPRLDADMFDCVASDEMVRFGKPAPDVYQAVMARLGVAAPDVVAIEDSVQSLASPIAAGVLTLVIPGAIASHQDFGSTPMSHSLVDFGGLAAIRALHADLRAAAA